jgi:hypothetical protein
VDFLETSFYKQINKKVYLKYGSYQLPQGGFFSSGGFGGRGERRRKNMGNFLGEQVEESQKKQFLVTNFCSKNFRCLSTVKSATHQSPPSRK